MISRRAELSRKRFALTSRLGLVLAFGQRENDSGIRRVVINGRVESQLPIIGRNSFRLI